MNKKILKHIICKKEDGTARKGHMAKVVHLRSVINLPGEKWATIDRTTRWGNPFVINMYNTREAVCDTYEDWLKLWIEDKDEVIMGGGKFSNRWVIENMHVLKGKDLACWCAPERCHGDYLLKLANKD